MARAKNKIEKDSEKQIIINELIGLALVALAFIVFASLYVMSRGIFTAASNPGAIGGFLVKVAQGLMGRGKLLFPIILLYLGYRYIKNNAGIKYDFRTFGIILLIFSLLIILHVDINFIDRMENIKAGLKGEGGGLIGALLVITFRTFFGLWGTWIIAGAFFVAGIIMTTRFSLKELLKKMGLTTKNVWQNNKDTIFDLLFVEEEISTASSVDSLPRAEEKNTPEQERKKFVLIDMSDHNSQKRSHLEEVNVLSEENQPLPPVGQIKINKPFKIDTDLEKDAEAIKEPQVLKDEIKAEKASHNKVNYKLPPLTLLDTFTGKSKNSQKDITERVTTLENTLQSFGISTKVTQVSVGPAVTRFELDIPPGVKVSKITGLADNIALSLASSGVRIAVIPNTSAIGIEVPNKEISPVNFRAVLENENFLKAASKLTVAFGKDISGQTIVADLTKMPHLLIAGSTGSGKSVCMNTLICSILFKATPKDVRFLMIDPKMVELSAYNGIPHLIAPVVIDPKKAAGVLKWVVTEMENRYEMFAQSGVKDIVRYNNQKEAAGNDLQKMHFIVVIIDELADLMMVAPQDVEESICRLAQMARAAGIHLVVATQRPSVDVITGLIKANIPSRIAFYVSSQTDSRTILDMGGAEKLLGRGDMLFHPVGEAKPLRIQGAFVSDKEVESIVSFLKNSELPQYDEKVMEIKAINSNTEDTELDDELFVQAGQLLIETGQASISMLQRRLKIGYSRAARLIDVLEGKGVVGGFEGSKPRRILMDLAQFNNLFSAQQLKD